jgi:hypothetical protein
MDAAAAAQHARTVLGGGEAETCCGFWGGRARRCRGLLGGRSRRCSGFRGGCGGRRGGIRGGGLFGLEARGREPIVNADLTLLEGLVVEEVELVDPLGFAENWFGGSRHRHHAIGKDQETFIYLCRPVAL